MTTIKCPAGPCEARIAPGELMCPEHQAMIPLPLLAGINRARARLAEFEAMAVTAVNHKLTEDAS